MQLSSISLAITRLGRTADPDAAIKALFASGEQGAWYDPSDLTTMFQDSTGTIPVTADGQPVGLILDKSQGLTLGPELIVNNDFSTNTWWTPANANASISGGVLNINSDGTYTGASKYSLLTVGTTYKVSADIVIISGTRGIFIGDTAVGYQRETTGAMSFTFGATGTTLEIKRGNGVGGLVATVDNVFCKKLFGNHASQATAAKRPLYKVTGLCKRNDFDAVDDVLNTTFPSSLGANCTVARGNVGAAPTILTGQTIGTSYANSTDHCGLIIVNRALTGQETADLTAWLTAKGATS